MRKALIQDAPAVLSDKTLKYKPTQEHFLRRLSSGLLIHWDSLPGDLQDLIIDQAAAVDDRCTETPTPLDIENFIRTVKLAKRQPVHVPSEISLDAASLGPSAAAIESAAKPNGCV